MEPSTRVCPFCGDLPGVGMFCAACGRTLAAVERLPTRAEWEAARPTGAGASGGAGSLAERCAAATAAYLEAMRAAGNPGATTFAAGKRSAFRRTPQIDGWVVRAVDREDFAEPRRYKPGLVLTVDGRFHQLDSELRGHGQRDFPRYEHSASADPIDMPASEQLLDELAALR